MPSVTDRNHRRFTTFAAVRDRGALRSGSRALVGAVIAAVVSLAGAGVAAAATPPYVQLANVPLALGTCDPSGPAPELYANFDLGQGGTYRYSPAFVLPYYFDDEGEFNLVYNQDVTLFVSQYTSPAGVRFHERLPVAPLVDWYVGYSRVAEHTELAVRVATYDARGATVAMSRITWDCTTGVVKSVQHRGNAIGAVAPTARAVEFHHAALDHYFISADPIEIGKLDSGALTGWRRTGGEMAVYTSSGADTQPVCRYYLPPAVGDSHFYSASPAECADVGVRFPGFTYESPAVFHVRVPDANGSCAPGTVPVYRLWNQRVDSNHRYTTDPAVKAQMLARGYVAEGYGPDAVAMCAQR